MTKRRIGILTGGGDVPGLNVAIKAVVTRAIDHEIEVIGLRRGWAALLNINTDEQETVDEWTMTLTLDKVRTIDRTGGTILHTSRTNPSSSKAEELPEFIRDDEKIELSTGKFDVTGHSLRVLETLRLDALIAIGGDDTLSYAARLHKEGYQVVGIPKTMDNDVFGTDYCIGFATAVSRSVDAISSLRTSLGSHERIGIVELFGRNSGETSLFAAYLADVDRAIISEVPFDIDRLINFLVIDRERNPSRYAVMTISEGATMIGGEIVQSGEADAFGHQKLGGIGLLVADEVKRRSGINIMYQQPAYLMRSGAPDALDIMVARSFGNLALDQVAMGHTGRMVSLQQGIYTTVPLEMVISGKKTLDVTAFYDTKNYRPKVRDVLGKPMFLY